MTVTLNDKQVSRIKELEQSALNKLTSALGDSDTKKKGVLSNQNAPCLIGSAIADLIGILSVVNKAEGK